MCLNSMSHGTRAKTGPSSMTAQLPSTRAKQVKMAEQSTLDLTSSKLDAALAAVEKLGETLNQTRASLEGKIDKVAIDLTHLRADHRKLADRTTAVESAVADIAPTVTATDKHVQNLLNRVEFLEGRVEDAEGRARRNNVRIVGLPEGKKGRHPTEYAESWLQTLLPEGTLSPHFVIERAHRVPARPPPVGSNPRPFLIRLLNYGDRDAILQETRKMLDVQIDNSKIMFFPDYTLHVQKQRHSFLAVKKHLRQYDLNYSLLFQARLRVAANGKAHFFHTPEEAEEWTDTYAPLGPENTATGASRPVPDASSHRRRTNRWRRQPQLSQAIGPDPVQVVNDQRAALQAVVDISRRQTDDTTSISSRQDQASEDDLSDDLQN